MAAAAASFALVALTGLPPRLVLLCLPLFLDGFGLVQSNAVAAITAVPRAAGTALAIIQFALAGISSATVGAGSLSLPASLSIAFAMGLAFRWSHNPRPLRGLPPNSMPMAPTEHSPRGLPLRPKLGAHDRLRLDSQDTEVATFEARWL